MSLFIEALQTLGIIGALLFSGLQARSHQLQLKSLQAQEKEQRNKSVYSVFDKFSDRMIDLRKIQLMDEQVRKIWDGGLEGEALKEFVDEKHFYFAKMLFQVNEAYFIALMDNDLNTEEKGFRYKPWRDNFKAELTAKNFRDIWSRHRIVRDSYSQGFRDEVNEIIAEIERGEHKH